MRTVGGYGYPSSNTVHWLRLHLDGWLEGPRPINRLVKTYPAGRWLSSISSCILYHPCILGAYPEDPLVGFLGGWGAGGMKLSNINMANKKKNPKRRNLDEDSDASGVFSQKSKN